MKRDYKFNEFSNLVKGFIVVTILSRNLEEFMEKEFKELYKSAYIHLMFIKHVEGISQMELSLLTGTNKSTLVRNLADLISKDYVIKKTSSRANENELYLTEKGLKTVEVIQNWIQDRELEIEDETKNFDNMKENVSSYMLKVIDLYSKY